jgi:hypothetical protein
VLSAVVATLALTLLWPFASDLFAFGPLHADDLSLTLGAGIVDIWTAAAKSLVLFQVISGRPIAPETDEVICGDRNFSGIDSTICATQK